MVGRMVDMNSGELRMELADTYNQLADLAQVQRLLTQDRVEVEATRDYIVKRLGQMGLDSD